MAIKQSKFDNRITIRYFFIKVWSNRCHKTAKVTKVPYLLDITNDYFSIFFGEAGMIVTIKLYNSAIATGDLIFRFVRCNKKESLPKNGELRTWCALPIGVYGQVTENFYGGTHCIAWLLLKYFFKESIGIILKNKLNSDL